MNLIYIIIIFCLGVLYGMLGLELANAFGYVFGGLIFAVGVVCTILILNIAMGKHNEVEKDNACLP